MILDADGIVDEALKRMGYDKYHFDDWNSKDEIRKVNLMMYEAQGIIDEKTEDAVFEMRQYLEHMLDSPDNGAEDTE